MNGLAAKISGVTKLIKAPKYFIFGIVILIMTLMLLPILKIIAIILGVLLIYIGFFPEHRISKQLRYYFNKLW